MKPGWSGGIGRGNVGGSPVNGSTTVELLILASRWLEFKIAAM
jgi:hypothetical protein